MPVRSSVGRVAIRIALITFISSCLWSADGFARQGRTASDGVYSSAQAQRGQQIYDAQCAACHGKQLEGGIGPSLAGELFLNTWRGRPVGELVDKIHKTMPVQAPGSLTDQQSIDVTARMLQVSKFAAGSVDLTPSTLAGVMMPGTRTAATTSAGNVTLQPVSNLAQYMRAITFPNANILFNVQVKDPAAEKPTSPVPFDYVKWGATVYFGWQAVDQAALALMETSPLFMMADRRCENGRPVPVNNADWKPYTDAVVEAARDAYRASQTRDMDKVIEVAEKLNASCENCHKRYRDGTAEGSSLGANRCR